MVHAVESLGWLSARPRTRPVLGRSVCAREKLRGDRTVRATQVLTPSFSSITLKFCVWMLEATPPVCASGWKAACRFGIASAKGEGGVEARLSELQPTIWLWWVGVMRGMTHRSRNAAQPLREHRRGRARRVPALLGVRCGQFLALVHGVGHDSVKEILRHKLDRIWKVVRCFAPSLQIRRNRGIVCYTYRSFLFQRPPNDPNLGARTHALRRAGSTGRSRSPAGSL